MQKLKFMSVKRIFQIAKELNISHTDILNFLQSRDVKINSHMSPVDESVHQMIMEEFAKDKEQVDRFRKEQVRKEIHDTKLKEQQSSSKKLELLSLSDQRELEKNETEKKNQELEEKKKQQEQEIQKKDEELRQRKKENEERKKKQEEKEKAHKTSSNLKAKALKKKFKSTKKLRSINLGNIQTQIGKGTSKQPSNKIVKKEDQVHKSVKTKVKGILAQMDTKTKKKVHKRSRTHDDEEILDPTEKPTIKVVEFSNVEELAKI